MKEYLIIINSVPVFYPYLQYFLITKLYYVIKYTNFLSMNGVNLYLLIKLYIYKYGTSWYPQ